MLNPRKKSTKHHDSSTVIGVIVCIILFASGFIITYLGFASGHPNYTTIACSIFISALVLFIAAKDLISKHNKRN